MLVLARKTGQQIVLPECGVTIEVLNVGKNQVRLGIAAPADIPVHRSEVWDRKCLFCWYLGQTASCQKSLP